MSPLTLHPNHPLTNSKVMNLQRIHLCSAGPPLPASMIGCVTTIDDHVPGRLGLVSGSSQNRGCFRHHFLATTAPIAVVHHLGHGVGPQNRPCVAKSHSTLALMVGHVLPVVRPTIGLVGVPLSVTRSFRGGPGCAVH